MTAAWQSIAPFLCLLCTALCNHGSSEVLWRRPGKNLTIQCRPDTEGNVRSLSVRMGLSENDVLYVHKDNLEKPLIKDAFQGRLQYSGTFPNLDIFIENLLLNDTGPYWCFYQEYNKIKNESETLKGKGSVLLVVSETHQEFPECSEPDQEKFLVAITVAAAVLFCILAGFILWLIFKTKHFCCAAKPKAAPVNHQVYEDMRGTLRR